MSNQARMNRDVAVVRAVVTLVVAGGRKIRGIENGQLHFRAVAAVNDDSAVFGGGRKKYVRSMETFLAKNDARDLKEPKDSGDDQKIWTFSSLQLRYVSRIVGVKKQPKLFK